MSDKTDIRSKSDKDIYDKQCNSSFVIRISDSFEFEDIIREYRHRKTTNSDSDSLAQEKQCYSDKNRISEKKEDIFCCTKMFLDYISKKIEEEGIRCEMPKSAMKKLVQEKL